MLVYKNCLSSKLSNNFPIYVNGIKGSYIAFYISALQQSYQKNIIIILPDEESCIGLQNDLSSIAENAFYFPALHKNDGVLQKNHTFNIQQRTAVQQTLVKQHNNIIITHPLAIRTAVTVLNNFKNKIIALSKKESVSYSFITEFLNEYGFLKNDFTYFPGQYSTRGNIIDVYSFANPYPYRIELRGNNIERLSEFHPNTQMSFNSLENIVIAPNLNEDTTEPTSILHYLNDDDIVILKDNIILQSFENPIIPDITDTTVFLNSEIITSEIKKKKIIEFGIQANFAKENIVVKLQPQPLFKKNFKSLIEHLQQQQGKGFTNYFTSKNRNQYKRLIQIINDSSEGINIKAESLIEHLTFDLNEGFIDEDCKTGFYTEHQVFDKYHHINKKNIAEETSSSLTLKDLIQLQPGDYVVHIDHGVGRFAGLSSIEVNGQKQDIIKLLYKNNDTLFVNIHNLYRLSKFSGKDGHEPKIDTLGSNRWQNLKQKVKQSVKQLAYDLIKLYAERKAAQGFAFGKDNYLQHELEASFPYEETPDQTKVIREVKRDMEKPSPMDRLVCGDVGFGKTEVAIRAAFKAATDGKQVAVLAPTTILAYQHFNTFSERLKDFPITIDYINRFRTSKEQKTIQEKLKNKKVDIIIGTHRLLSKDFEFADLGLLIIDEEHKFGVSDKDKIKLIKKNVDTLTLTATPIPRTLQFSLIGARDLSVIQTPPPNRYPVKTELHALSDELIQQAILKEVERSGQVFFVHNKVQDIFELAAHIQQLVPNIKISIAHGQMKSNELENAMLNFIHNDSQVLISTNIIESGLDISNANTIIINNAQNFGLSDLHQLRGRVGRSNKQAFCHLVVPSLHILTNDAKKRLNVILDFSDLGSGFQIAMKDLDIRGAGNLLGAEQSGFINEVGIDTYMKILNETIVELKQNEDESTTEKLSAFSHQLITDTVLDTDLPLFIPESYVNNSSERLNLYRQLNSCTSHQQLDTFKDSLKDRFGDIPIEATELIDSVVLRWKASKLGIEKLVLKNKKMIAVLISNPEHAFYKTDLFRKLMSIISKHHNLCQVKEQNNKLLLIFENTKNIHEAFIILQNIQSEIETL